MYTCRGPIPRKSGTTLTHTGTFHASDTVASVYQFVADSLGQPGAAFVLKAHPSNTPLLHSATLGQAGLLPASIVNFAADYEPPYLRQDVADMATPL